MELRTDIVLITQLLRQVEDPKLIEEIKSLLAEYFSKNQEVDIWDDLSENEKAFIERSRQQHREGKGIPHADVMKELRQQIGK